MRAPHFSLAPLKADWNSSLFSQLYKVRSDTPSTAATSLLVRGSRSVGGVISHSKYSCRTSSAILLPFCAIKPPRRTRLTTTPPMRRNLHHRRTIRIEHSNNIIDSIDSIQLVLRCDHDRAYAVLLRRRPLLQSLPRGTLCSEPAALSTGRTTPHQRHMMRSLSSRQRTNSMACLQRR